MYYFYNKKKNSIKIFRKNLITGSISMLTKLFCKYNSYNTMVFNKGKGPWTTRKTFIMKKKKIYLFEIN